MAAAGRTYLPTEHVFTGLAILAGVFVLAAGIWIGRDMGAITVTRTVHVKQSWGKPDAKYSAATVNPQLAKLGMTVCEMYSQRRTMVCHP